jgi:CheY-like chemotaxis protein
MSTESPTKLRVLVVDDDKQWLDALLLQGAELSRTTKLDIEATNSFREGIQFLEDDRNVDVIVVDYFLDHSHLASEFITKARAMGLAVPYVIISGAESNAVVNDRGQLDSLVQSSPSDFIEKIEIRSFRKFQDRIFESHRKFRENVAASMTAYFVEQKVVLHSIYILSAEIRSLHQLVRSYSAKVNEASFSELCAVIESDVDGILAYVRHAEDLLPDHPTLNKMLTFLENQEVRSRGSQKLQTSHYIPYSKNRKRTVSWLKRWEGKLLGPQKNSVSIKALLSSLLEREDESSYQFAERITLHLAEQCAGKGYLERGVDLLFYLSQLFAGRRENKRVAGVDMLTAAYLCEHGRTEEAANYLHSARTVSGRLNDREMEKCFQRLTSLH